MINVNNPPIHQVQRGCVRAAVYENVSEEARYVVLFKRVRLEDGRWTLATGYRRTDIVSLALLALDIFDWLNKRVADDRAKEQEEADNIIVLAPMVGIGKEDA